MSQLIEFIESYRKVGNDYQWYDNHGELIRCKDCVYHGEHKTCLRGDGLAVANDYDYCSNGVRKEV